jgi:hypothetical protein
MVVGFCSGDGPHSGLPFCGTCQWPAGACGRLVGPVLSRTYVLLSLDGFQCAPNPNGKLTLNMDRSVICWADGEHAGIVIASVFALLVYPVSFLAATWWDRVMKYKSFCRRS